MQSHYGQYQCANGQCRPNQTMSTKMPMYSAPMQMSMVPNPYTHSFGMPISMCGPMGCPPQWQQLQQMSQLQFYPQRYS
ncbi:hypothetical protein BpHYR1_040834 [Brachionus plicatilis]|uniref:Uncharacterized protein n=1 Tax=Brachionus plicatilis TaxID=10195 RepID=A0A3M7P182_BRAPC|nr:hypothetical protein BpHYR1_040834 [Brachionus plicatilis]